MAPLASQTSPIAGKGDQTGINRDDPTLVPLSHCQTYLDQLPSELLNKILSYVTPEYDCDHNLITGFHHAWPGSYYASLTEPYLHSDLEFETQNSDISLREIVDRVLERPETRFWVRYLKLDLSPVEDPVWFQDVIDWFDDPFDDQAQQSAPRKPPPEEEEYVYLRNAATMLFGDIDERVVPRVHEVLGMKARVRFLIYLFPNIEKLHVTSEKMGGITEFRLFKSAVQLYRNTLTATGDAMCRDAVDNYLENAPEAALDFPLLLQNVKYFTIHRTYKSTSLPSGSILLGFFLPRIKSFSGKMICRAPFNRSGPGYDLYHYAPLYGTSPVTSLTLLQSDLGTEVGCLLRIPKVLKAFTYNYYRNSNAGFHLGDIAWGLEPHKASLEELELAMAYDHYTHDQLPPRNPKLPYEFPIDRISTLSTFTSLRKLTVSYWMLAGLPRGSNSLTASRDYHSDGSLTNLPASLEILNIFITNINGCGVNGCQNYNSPCNAKMRNLVELLERRNELTPRLRKLKIELGPIFAHDGYMEDSIRELTNEVCKMLIPLGESVGVNIVVSFDEQHRYSYW